MDLDCHTPTRSRSAEETDFDDTPPHDLSPSVKSHHPPPPAFKECMKNHAAAIGGHAVDGCGEYMPLPTADLNIPATLTCGACGCHRNFHRRVPEFPTVAITPPFIDFRRPGPPSTRTSSLSPPRPSLGYAPHSLLALSTAVAAEEHRQRPLTPTGVNAVGRKRVRSKFTDEQKEKMHSFSKKLGWKMRKSDDDAVEEFCRDVGVDKVKLKVWMHNNKKKRETGGGVETSNNGGDGESDNGGNSQNESGSRASA